MVKNEFYEQAIEKIAPKLEKLKGLPLDEILQGLYQEIIKSGIPTELTFALIYVLDPSRFCIKVLYSGGEYSAKFTANNLPQSSWHINVFVNIGEGKRPTDKEIRDLIKKRLSGTIWVEGLIKRAEEVVDTCKIIPWKD